MDLEIAIAIKLIKEETNRKISIVDVTEEKAVIAMIEDTKSTTRKRGNTHGNAIGKKTAWHRIHIFSKRISKRQQKN